MIVTGLAFIAAHEINASYQNMESFVTIFQGEIDHIYAWKVSIKEYIQHYNTVIHLQTKAPVKTLCTGIA